MTDQNSPKWFQEAIAEEPEKLSVKIKGTKIVYNAWAFKGMGGGKEGIVH